MSKRFNSLLIGALAAFVLGAPVQAQFARQAYTGKAATTMVRQTQELKKLESPKDKAEFKAMDAQKQEKVLAEVEKKQLPRRPFADKQLDLTTPRWFGNMGIPMATLQSAHADMPIVARTAARHKVEAVDENGVITAPAEGELKFYDRAGMGTYVQNQRLYSGEQTGKIRVVECEDGTVYFQDFISNVSVGTWLKGTREGNTITVPAKQVLYFWADQGYGIYIAKCSYDGSSAEWTEVEGDITLTVDGDVITLDDTAAPGEGNVIALFYTDDYTFSGYSDWSSVFTYDPTYVVPELVTLPEDAVVEEWYSNAVQYSQQTEVPVKRTAKVSFYGDEVYLSGIFTEFPDAWVKGTKDGNTVTFPKLQFVGEYGSYLVKATGCNEEGSELQDFVMTYDAEAETLTSQNLLVANASDTELYYLELYLSLQLSKNAPGEPVAEVGEPIDELPFENAFDDYVEDFLPYFGVIDSNDDGNSWNYNTEGYMRYSYALEAADDWFVTPAIKLEAGRKYHFAIDAWAQSTNYPERIEVKLGDAPKASALTQEVIAATDVTWKEPVTLENEDIVVAETGYYYFGIHAISDADQYYLFADNLLIEATAEGTAPAAITDLTVTSFTSGDLGAVITFTAPSTSIDGNPLTSNLTKIELLRDGKVIATFENVAPGTAITYTDQAEDLTAGKHAYQAIAYNASGAGKKSVVVEQMLTCIYEVPYTAALTDANTFALFQVIDANADGTTWSQDSYGANVSYNSNESANDYLISAPIRMTAGKSLSVVVNANAYSNSYPERLEVLVGNAPTVEAMTITAIPATDVIGTDVQEFEGFFTVPEDGVYYVAIHGISDPDMFRLYVSSLTVDKGLEPTSPAAPRLAVQPDPFGYEKATVTVTAPANTFGGSRLTENLSQLVIYRDGEAIKTFENVAPQETKVFVDMNVSGQHTYQAYPYDQNGERGQKSARVKTFVGLDVPATPEVAARETENSVILSWQPVSAGANGGIVVADDVKYNIWTIGYEDSWFGPMPYLDQLIATTTDTSIELPVEMTGDQDVLAYGVEAVNSTVADGGGNAALVNYFSGAPYTLPFVENFGASGFTYGTWLITDASASGDYGQVSDASDGDNGAMAFAGYEAGQYVYCTPGKISLAGTANPYLVIDLKSTVQGNLFKIYVETISGNRELLAAFQPGADYKTYKVSLANYISEPFVKVIIGGDFKAAGQINFDNCNIVDLLEYDLAVSVNAPKSIMAGNTANVQILVKNEGQNIAKGFKLTVKADDVVLGEEDINLPIGSFETQELEIEYPTTIFDDAADVVLSAAVDYDDDLDLDDNVAETTISVKQSTAAAPENVQGEKTDNGVKLIWSAPSSATETFTENFEDTEAYPEFSLGGITADVHYGQLGGWTLYDGNGTYCYGFNGITVPNLGEPSAFIVMNPASTQLSQDLSANYPANSGSQYLVSVCTAEPEGNIADTDHWLISPALPGVAQTISFFTREFTDSYGPEVIQILASSTDNKVESFSLIATENVSWTDWQEVSFDLPEGTTYFAIRHISNDVFGLMIDDITYTRGGGSIAGYNVWVDGELAETTTATSIELAGASTSSVFAVSAVYSNGAQSKPVVFVFSNPNQQPTAIVSITGSNEPADIYSIDGRLVRSQATDVKGLKGAYIINGQKVVLK